MNARRFACALLAALTLALVPAVASAVEAPRWYQSDTFHFGYLPDVGIATTQVSSPEGPVDLITIRPIDTVSGEYIGTSFITFTVYNGGVDTAPVEGGTPAEVALNMTVEHLVAAFEGAITPRRTEFQLGHHDVVGAEFEMADGDVRARGYVGALLAEGDAVIVFYFHRTQADIELFAGLNDVAYTFGLGEAPSYAPPIGSDAP